MISPTREILQIGHKTKPIHHSNMQTIKTHVLTFTYPSKGFAYPNWNQLKKRIGNIVVTSGVPLKKLPSMVQENISELISLENEAIIRPKMVKSEGWASCSANSSRMYHSYFWYNDFFIHQIMNFYLDSSLVFIDIIISYSLCSYSSSVNKNLEQIC